MTPSQIADVIAKRGPENDYVNIQPENQEYEVIHVSLSTRPAGFELLFPKSKLPKTKAALFKKMGGKVTPDRVAIDPFTREEKTVKGYCILHAKTAEQAATQGIRVFIELWDYPQETIFLADEGLA